MSQVPCSCGIGYKGGLEVYSGKDDTPLENIQHLPQPKQEECHRWLTFYTDSYKFMGLFGIAQFH